MKRRGFLRALGIGAVATVVAPKAILAVKEKPIKAIDIVTGEGKFLTSGGLKAAIEGKGEMIMYTGKLRMEDFENAMMKVFGADQEPFPLNMMTKGDDKIIPAKFRRKGFTYNTHYAQAKNVYKWNLK